MAGIAFIFGLFWGSFLNVLIDRLPQGEDVIWGRSYCDHCKKTLRWFELIPVVSYIVLRGRCLRCKKSLPLQYPLIEIVTALGCMMIIGHRFVSPFHTATAILLFSVFLVIFFSDLKYQIIPDSMVIFSALGAFFWVFLTQWQFFVLHLFTGLGALSLFLCLWLFTGKRGIGFGDVKLSFVLGLLLGYPGIVIALYIAFLTGAAAGVILIVGHKKSLKSKIAFGPFLIFGTAVMMLLYTQCMNIWNVIL